MSKIKLNLKPIINVKELEFKGTTIKVKRYITMEDKLNIVQLTLQECMENGFVNIVRVEAIFNALVCAKYTNIDFTDELEDIYSLYDMVKTNGLLDSIIEICYNDYCELYELLNIMIDKYEDYLQSFIGIAMAVVNEIPEKVKEVAKEIDSFDSMKLQEIFNMVKEVGGSKQAIVNTLRI